MFGKFVDTALTCLLVLCLNLTHAKDEHVSTLRDQEALLICPIDVASCGELHSVKWFKGRERIAVVSGDGEVANIEGPYQGRLSIDHSPHGPATRLHIKAIQVNDEDAYECESTYLEPLETCASSGSYIIELKVLVPPSAILVLDEKDNPIQNTSTLGPLREGNQFTSKCEVRGARPAPTVGWYMAGKRLTDSVTIDEANGLFSVKSVLELTLSRQELSASLECRVETPALENLVSNHLHLDLQVRPTKIALTGVKHHTVQDTKVLLQCEVLGARPAANVSWYNDTTLLTLDENDKTAITTKTYLQNDGTFETKSQLVFTATRFENGVPIKCEADNVVMREDKDRPIHDVLVLEVLYPPVVTVKPDNITVTELENILLQCQYEANPATIEQVKWYKNDQLLDIKNPRYEGGVPENTALLIKDAWREDIGEYSCELTNSIGPDISDNKIYVDILYVPTVQMTMDPESPVIENNARNVTLSCNVVDGNPSTLDKVKWFLDGLLLKELPECTENSENSDNLCGIDPSKMVFENAGRAFLGNYSCEGFNLAGWGQRSAEKELVVYYEPGNATLLHYPTVPVKRKSVTFSCSVDDGGNPNATRYRWLRGGRPVMDVVTPNWTVDPVGLDSRTNFSCYAYNEGGDGVPATIELDVHAPPAFIQKLPPYTGSLFSTAGVALSCRVECTPACSISWFKDGIEIDESGEQYYVKETLVPAEPSVGDFESILSVLHFNMSAWPDSKFDIYKDNSNYSCVSTHNEVGPGVRSVTYFGVEYPPENTTVSSNEISVIEGSIPQRVLCSAKAYPEPVYEWRRNNEVIAKGNALIINQAVMRSDGGGYKCVSMNKHGNHTSETFLNILYKPNCTITRREINDEDTLICTAYGNPEESDFVWTIKSENDTFDNLNARSELATSYLVLSDDFTVMRTYRCVANNTVGPGTYCEIDVAGQLPWWQRLDSTTLIILIAAVAALLLAVIIVCIIIICICRKRRRQDKYHTETSSSISQSVFQMQSAASQQNARIPSPEIPKSPPKWPLRPGVHVHVKTGTKQNLCAARTTTQNPTCNGKRSAAPNESGTSETLNITGTSATPILHNNLGLPGTMNPQSTPIAPTAAPHGANANNLNTSNCYGNVITQIVNKNYQVTPEVNGNEVLLMRVAAGAGSATAANANVCQGEDVVDAQQPGLLDRILRRLNFMRHNETDNDDGCEANHRTQRRRRGGRFQSFFKSTGWLASRRSNTSSASLMDRRLKGITVSDGAVTYKRATAQDQRQGSVSDALNNESRKRKQCNNIRGNSSQAGDPLTEPGEYENLPFHGLQSAPNKFHANIQNSNAVHVASSRANNPSGFKCNSTNNFPSNYPVNYPNNNVNFTSLTRNNLNYPQYSTSGTPSVVSGAATAFQRFLPPTDMESGGGAASCASSTIGSTSNGKRYDSLKTLRIKKPSQFYSMRVNKCKRHVSQASATSSKANKNQTKSQSGEFNNGSTAVHKSGSSGYNTYEQPQYENLTDSIQIHESSAGCNDTSLASIINDFNCEIDRNSIYRSDSGISNSSYECITPTPAPRVNQRKYRSAPVYMNLPNLSGSIVKSHSKSVHNSSTTIPPPSSLAALAGKSGYQSHPLQHSSKCKNKQSSVAGISPFSSYEPLADLADDMVYADVDLNTYGPINYKAASVYALVKKQKNGNLKEVKPST